MSFLAVEVLALIMFVALAVIAGKGLLAAERDGVGVRGIFRRSMRDGFLSTGAVHSHGGDAADPMHLQDELAPLPFRHHDGGEGDPPHDGRIRADRGV